MRAGLLGKYKQKMTPTWGVPGSIICTRKEVYKQNINRKKTERKWQLLEVHLEGSLTASSGRWVRTRSWTPWSRRKWQRVPLDFWKSSFLRHNSYQVHSVFLSHLWFITPRVSLCYGLFSRLLQIDVDIWARDGSQPRRPFWAWTRGTPWPRCTPGCPPPRC